MAHFLDAADSIYVELSDSTAMPEPESEAPSVGGLSSSAEEVASDNTTEDTTPCERGGDNCACCNKRKRVHDCTIDMIEENMSDIVEAIDKFHELYKKVENRKRCKKPKEDLLLERMAKMNTESEERIQKFMLEQQVVMAKIIADVVKDSVGRCPESPAEKTGLAEQSSVIRVAVRNLDRLFASIWRRSVRKRSSALAVLIAEAVKGA